jgi:threonine dehydrogenase-like Zn-dependent dehydrogenase
MQALALEPGQVGSARVIDFPAPKPASDEVVVRVLEVGVCGTDREICAGHLGSAPQGESLLVLGHELLGVVERGGSGFQSGQLVSASVRRSCGACLACLGDEPEACFTGAYLDRGITGFHGFAAELVCESASNLFSVPAKLGRLGVLIEPTAVCERALRQACIIGNRQAWELRRALVLGAGPIGCLTAALLRLAEIDVVVAAAEERVDFVDLVGASYLQLIAQSMLDELGGFDLVVEAAGDAELLAASRGLLRRGGVACLIGLDGRAGEVQLLRSLLGIETVLENRVLFGSVSAGHNDYLAAAIELVESQERWPEALDLLIGLRVSVDDYAEALAHRGSKATLLFS